VNRRLIVLWVLLSCGRSDQKPQSHAVAVEVESGGSSAAMQVVSGTKPIVSAESLASRWPSLGALESSQLRAVMIAFNLVPGPCGPCWLKHESLAECALREPVSGCGNIPSLVRRAARMAARNVDESGLRQALNYPDIWIPSEQEDGVVQVGLWIEDQSHWAEQATATAAALLERFPSDVQVQTHDINGARAKQVDARTTPTWTIAGYRMRGAQSLNALARIVDRERQDIQTEEIR
jgi:hypothetical protein